jgi:hypothetical protein
VAVSGNSEAPGRTAIVEIGPDHQELRVLVYPVGMSVSTRTLTFVAQELRKHRRMMGSRWRVLSSHQQALMLLAHLRKGETYRDLAHRVRWRDHHGLPVPA